MQELNNFTDQIRDLFHFFVSAEVNNSEITYEQIQERLGSRSYDTLVWYANNFWTWFLSKKKEKRGRYRIFVCHDLQGYPEDFFVAAHQPRRGKYFYHFGKALDASRERAEDRKQAKGQAGQSPIETGLTEPPLEAEQEFPDALHIANNEAEEEEEGNERSEDLTSPEPSLPPVEPPHLTASPAPMETSFSMHSLPIVPPTPLTARERIFDMFDFSRKNREAMEQLRLAVETQMRTFTQERELFSREVINTLEEIKHTLEAQTQQISLIPTEVSQLRASVVNQVQVIEQTLTQEQIRLHGQVAGRVEELAGEFHQLRTSPHLLPVEDTLTRKMQEIEQALAELIKQSSTPPDFASIRNMLQSSSNDLLQRLLSALQQPDALLELPQITATLAEVQQQISSQLPKIEQHLTSLTKQFAGTSSVSPNGQVRDIQKSIRDAAAQARDALNTLEQDCVAWLDQLGHHVQTIQNGHEETSKRIQLIQSYVFSAKEETSPNGKEIDNGTVANGSQEHEEDQEDIDSHDA